MTKNELHSRLKGRFLGLGWASPAPDAVPAQEFTALLDLLAAEGYCGIEAFISGPYRTGVKPLQKMLAERGLELIGVRTGGLIVEHGHSLSAADPARRKQAVAALDEVIEFTAGFGTPRILLGMMQGPPVPGVRLDDARGWIAESLAHCARTAAKYQMEIDLEPVNRYILGYNGTVASVLEMIGTVGEPNLHLLIDSFHMHIEEQSIAAAILRGAGQIRHVHLADSNRRPPGQGHFNFAEFFGTLAAVGYGQYLSVECDYVPDQLTAVHQAARYLANWLAEEAA
jgi:5-keto-L-gluconate epimerase